VGDWVVGSGSADQKIRRGGHLVYAMRITEVLNFQQYNSDPRFEKKKPYRTGSRMQSCGDNIYFRNGTNSNWVQRDSFHSNSDGTQNFDHTAIDTNVDRILISNEFVYFGGDGPHFPDILIDVCKFGIGHSCINNTQLIEAFTCWIRSLGVLGFQSAPYEWRMLREK
jgi:hypothetical protein